MGCWFIFVASFLFGFFFLYVSARDLCWWVVLANCLHRFRRDCVFVYNRGCVCLYLRLRRLCFLVRLFFKEWGGFGSRHVVGFVNPKGYVVVGFVYPYGLLVQLTRKGLVTIPIELIPRSEFLCVFWKSLCLVICPSIF